MATAIPEVGAEGLARRGVGRRRALVRAAGVAGFLGVVALVVVGAVIPGIHSARKARCAANFKQLGLALSHYMEPDGIYPAPSLQGSNGTPLLSWRVALLPALGHRSLYDRFRLDEPWDSPHNVLLLKEMPPEYRCPEGRGGGEGRTNYRVVVGPKSELGSVNTAFEPGRGVDVRELLDGTSGTVFIVESSAEVPWTKPDELTFPAEGPPKGLGSRHAGGFHAVFGDGSIRFLKWTINPVLLRALFTINGGEVTSDS